MPRNIERTCCVCRTKQDKKNMNRLTLDCGQIKIDNQKVLTGKGCYICKNDKCIEELNKKKCLNRFYKCNICECEYTKICEELKSCK